MRKISLLMILLSILFISSDSYSQAWRSRLYKSKKTVKKVKKEEKKEMNTDYIHWFGQSAVRIEDAGFQIYIDPFKLPGKELEKADIILITHSHYDHYSPDDIERIRKPETVIFIPEDLKDKVRGETKMVKPGLNFDIGKVKIKTVSAYNIDKKFHPKSNNWVGYIITLSNGLTIYHAGDSDTIPEMRDIHVDIAMVPIGGTYTMTASEAAVMMNIIQPKVAIPMHFGGIVGTQQDADLFKKEVKTQVTIKKPEK